MSKLGYTFYPKDFISDPDVMMMTPEERGIYRDLIDLAYMSQNKIKYNLFQLAKYCNSTEDKIAEVLSLKGCKKGEFWTIPSCNKRIMKATVSKENGQKGGRPKKPKKNPEQNLNITQSERQIEKEREIENKIEIKKEIKNNITLNFSEEVFSCYENCITFFEKDLIPQTVNQKNKWLECIDKLHRLENLQYSDIELIVKKTREDEFWSKNFLTLLKLRRKDRNGIPYWKVFREKFKVKKSNIEETYNSYEQVKRELGL